MCCENATKLQCRIVIFIENSPIVFDRFFSPSTNGYSEPLFRFMSFDRDVPSWATSTNFNIKGSFSCKWVKKSIFFFHHYSIVYAFRNTHVKFQAGIRKIVEVINFCVMFDLRILTRRLVTRFSRNHVFQTGVHDNQRTA